MRAAGFRPEVEVAGQVARVLLDTHDVSASWLGPGLMLRFSVPPNRSRKPWYRNSTKVYIRRNVAKFAKATEPGMLVLDAGAGASPYRRHFDHAKYEAADFAQLSTRYAPLDYVCDLTDIPVDDDHFDRIICNQVLEHLPEPGAVLTELNRVLKPGGRILLTAPLYFAEHQVPYDFYRYTRYSLRRLFEQAGFAIDRIDWLEGYFGTMSYAFRQMYAALPRNLQEVRRIEGGWRLIYLAPLLFGTRWLARVLHTVYFHADLRWKYTTSRGLAKDYLVLANKPGDASRDEDHRSSITSKRP